MTTAPTTQTNTPVPTDDGNVTITKCHFKRLLFHNNNNGYTVATYSSSDYDEDGFVVGAFVAVGTFLPCDANTDIILIGKWTEHKNKKTGTSERQFAASDCLIDLPTSKSAMITYLSSGQIDGCGKRTAEKIVDAFGDDTYKVLESPEGVDKVAALPRVPRSKAERIVESFLKNTYARSVITECAKFGITPNKSLKLYKEYGNETLKTLRVNPYRICEIEGFGFTIADTIAREVVFRGVPFDASALVRLKAGIMHVLKQEMLNNGHLYVVEHTLLLLAKALLEGIEPKEFFAALNKGEFLPPASGLPALSYEQLKKAYDSLVNDGAIRVFTFTGVDANGNKCSLNYSYTPFALKAEENIARFAFDRCSYKAKVTVDDDKLLDIVKTAATSIGFFPSQKQVAAAMMVLKNNFSIITGGPGTGKTSVIKTVIKAFESLWATAHSDTCTVALAAPTGRAARRMTESCGYPAKTIHALLGLRPDQNERPTDLDEIDADLLIVDEFSMVDVFLANHLIQNIPHHTKIVFVGDAAQLPSVGPGAVFSELIKSQCVPVTELTEIFRQKGDDAGCIVENAALIREGKTNLRWNRNSFQYMEAANSVQGQQFIIEAYKRELMNGGTPDSVQVLTPRRTEVATSAGILNPYLREVAHNIMYSGLKREVVFTIAGTEYCIGDKIMQLKNTPYVSNGDVGYITKTEVVDDEVVAIVDFNDGRVLQYSKKEMENVVHAYACTIHKSQGSEYGTVIIPLLGEHYIMLERSLFYTAVTRAVKRVIIVTATNSYGYNIYLNKAITNMDGRTRATLLSYFIKELFDAQSAQAAE